MLRAFTLYFWIAIMKEVKAKNETNAVIDTVAPEQDKFNVITLDVPIVRGGNTITEVTVNKPNAGALRGVRLQALMETDVDALIRVLPRITTPNLTVPEVNNLDPADIYALSQALALFFLPNSVRSDYLPV
ncbi:tail protein [Yersinia phage vB_YenM_42.18]|uniref:Tail protein n=3 Tax=root TaxID=1 RepID=A0AAE9FQM7_9CAUD|nr:tail protein [Yersinia phage vB_YenM_42.18]UNA05762.1 tail protein [Yersinia phage vB_YenM_42.18]CCV36880.1 putative phage tail protein [Yersinia enterocolitica (type O:9) str. YE56/03]